MYEGDKFGTGGSYIKGMVYLSRMAGSSDLTTNPSAGEGERKLSDEDLAEEERIRAAAAVTGAHDGALDDDLGLILTPNYLVLFLYATGHEIQSMHNAWRRRVL